MRRASILLGVLAALPAESAASPGPNPGGQERIRISAVSRPAPLRVGDREFLTYELELANPMQRTFTLSRLRLEAASGDPLLTLAGTGFEPAAACLPAEARGGLVDVDGLHLDPGTRSLLYLWIELGPERERPAAVMHRFEGPAASSLGSLRWSHEGLRAPVLPDPVLIDPPVRGGTWLVANGFSNAAEHRRCVTGASDTGEPLIGQRFGADFLKLARDGSNARGDGARLTDHHSYGEHVYAVADGEVVALRDRMPDNPVGEASGPLSPEDHPGNHVILRLSPDTYAMYVHLRPGSLRVEVGDEVRRGDRIGRIGNSGDVSAPHLNFHLGDRPQVNASQGVPFHFRSFEQLAEDYRFLPTRRLPRRGTRFEHCVPGERWVVRFP